MKKKILFWAITMVAVVANADYLNWTVGSTFGGMTSGDDYNSAKIFYVTSVNQNTGGKYLDSIGSTPGASSVDLSSIGTTSGLGFYIEVYNYTDSGYGEVVAKSDYYAYSSLDSKAITTSFLNAAAIAYAFNGSGVVATPEPTSGLLLLMGFAMLGLKRKKEV